MTNAQRELCVARICSGQVQLRLPTVTLVVRQPSRLQRYQAELLYQEQLREAELQGLPDEQGLRRYLQEQGLWSDQDTSLLKALPSQIEDLKIQLYKLVFRRNAQKTVRAAISKARTELAHLEGRLRQHEHLSAEGVAQSARLQFLFATGLHYKNGTPVFGDNPWEGPVEFLEAALGAWAELRLSEAHYRELARTDPWRTIWGARKASLSVFGVDAADLSDEQRTLVRLSTLYDSIYEHPECPADEVLEDDDMLDGWLLEQGRQRKRQANTKRVENLQGQEVYLMAETEEDAREVISLNDDQARATLRARHTLMEKRGEVNEMDMPDTKQRLQMEATNKLRSAYGL